MNNDETTCPECAEAIKAAARVCKHCGYRIHDSDRPSDEAERYSAVAPLELHQSSGFKPWHYVAGTVIVVLSTAVVFASSSSLRPKQSTASFNVLALAQDYLKKDLKDPESAQFADLFNTGRCVTGQMNAKNGFGAYTGFSEFYYDAEKGVGRLQPARPSIDEADMEAYHEGMKAVDSFNHDRAVCMKGEEQTARDEAAVAKRIADSGLGNTL